MVLENYNKNLLKYLSNRSISMNKYRNCFIVFSIMLAVTLVMTLSLVAFGSKQATIKIAEKISQASFSNISEETIFKIKNDTRVDKVGVNLSLGEIKFDNCLLYCMYYDEEMLNGIKISGKIPQASNELLVPRQLLENLGKETALGQKISLNLGAEEKEFIVTGLFNQEKTFGTFNIYFSKQYIKDKLQTNNIKYYTLLWLKDAQRLSEKELKENILSLAETYNIKDTQVSFSDSYFSIVKRKIGFEKIFLYGLIISIILSGAVLVVYSIFNIFVGEKIREYGQLRTIGATKKQIRKMVKREGRVLGIIGIILGLFTGAIIGYFLRPEGWKWTNTMIATIMSGIFGILVVYFSTKKPAKIASNVTPTESMNYSVYVKYKGTSKISNNKIISPVRIAILNLTRNGKRTFLAILSMGFCGLLLMCASTVQNSYSAEYMVKALKFPYGDLSLTLINDKLNDESEKYEIAHIQQKNNSLNDELKEKVLGIDGVQGIKVWETTVCRFSVEGTKAKDEINHICGFTENDVEKISSTLVQGTIDYKTLSEKYGIVINKKSNSLKEVYGWDPKIGEKIEMSFLKNDGTSLTKTFTIMAITNGKDAFEGFLRIPAETLREITKYNCTMSWEVKVDKNKISDVQNQLETLSKKSKNIALNTFDDSVLVFKSPYQKGFMFIYALVIFIGVFGLVTLINTRTTDFIARKQQTAIIQAIGMTKRQLRTTFLVEGFIYAIWTIGITLLLGTPLGYVVIKVLKNNGVVLNYRFPLVTFIIFALGIIVVQFILSVILIRRSDKQSLINKIRERGFCN